ncbi:MAG: hypothetical protein KIT48_04740 [Pseudolabrys sp.]|nr:hypothetical protein [Pseudolabrys sp.]
MTAARNEATCASGADPQQTRDHHMTSTTLSAAPSRRMTTTITRDGAGLGGPRLITDDASALCVRVFGFTDIATVIAGGALDAPGAYILVGMSPTDCLHAAYIGETGRLGRRLQEHAADVDKAFATEVYVLYDADGRRIDKNDAVHLQRRLIELVEQAGSARLINSTSACTAKISQGRAATVDKMLVDVLPLLFDAGCRFLSPAPVPPMVTAAAKVEANVSTVTNATPLAAPEPVAGETSEEDDDGGPMEIGVSTTPIGVEELELAYSDLWARGYDYRDRFVVAAGSEMRLMTNGSANDRTKARRDRLIEAQAFDDCGAGRDRYRLRIAVAFPSRAIAAKVLCGAHVASDKWRPLNAARPLMFDA